MQQTLGSLLKVAHSTKRLPSRSFEDVSNEEADAILGNLYLPIKCCLNLAVTNSIFTK
jgi:hypothetical protein